MADHTQKSQEALVTTNKQLEKSVFWGMIFACVVVVFGMIKGMFG